MKRLRLDCGERLELEACSPSRCDPVTEARERTLASELEAGVTERLHALRISSVPVKTILQMCLDKMPQAEERRLLARTLERNIFPYLYPPWNSITRYVFAVCDTFRQNLDTALNVLHCLLFCAIKARSRLAGAGSSALPTFRDNASMACVQCSPRSSSSPCSPTSQYIVISERDVLCALLLSSKMFEGRSLRLTITRILSALPQRMLRNPVKPGTEKLADTRLNQDENLAQNPSFIVPSGETSNQKGLHINSSSRSSIQGSSHSHSFQTPLAPARANRLTSSSKPWGFRKPLHSLRDSIEDMISRKRYRPAVPFHSPIRDPKQESKATFPQLVDFIPEHLRGLANCSSTYICRHKLLEGETIMFSAVLGYNLDFRMETAWPLIEVFTLLAEPNDKETALKLLYQCDRVFRTVIMSISGPDYMRIPSDLMALSIVSLALQLRTHKESRPQNIPSSGSTQLVSEDQMVSWTRLVEGFNQVAARARVLCPEYQSLGSQESLQILYEITKCIAYTHAK